MGIVQPHNHVVAVQRVHDDFCVKVRLYVMIVLVMVAAGGARGGGWRGGTRGPAVCAPTHQTTTHQHNNTPNTPNTPKTQQPLNNNADRLGRRARRRHQAPDVLRAAGGGAARRGGGGGGARRVRVESGPVSPRPRRRAARGRVKEPRVCFPPLAASAFSAAAASISSRLVCFFSPFLPKKRPCSLASFTAFFCPRSVGLPPLALLLEKASCLFITHTDNVNANINTIL